MDSNWQSNNRLIVLPELNILTHGQSNKFRYNYQCEKQSEFEVCPKCAVKSYSVHDRRWCPSFTNCGRICTKTLKVSLSRSLAGQQVGIKEMEDGIWVVSFMDYDLGYFDERGSRVEPADDPFGFQKV